MKKEAQESDIESAARAILPEMDRLDDFQRANFISMYTRGKAALEYEYNLSKGLITTKSTLIRCEKLMAEMNDADYNLSRVTNNIFICTRPKIVKLVFVNVKFFKNISVLPPSCESVSGGRQQPFHDYESTKDIGNYFERFTQFVLRKIVEI